MPWDAGGTPAELDQYLAAEGAGGRVLIPGCGTAYEVQAFLRAGYHVSAIDFSPAAVEMAKLQIGALPAELYFGDFFTYAFGVREFDVIYERAFLASLPRAMWHDYAARVYELLRQGGKLIGFFLYGDKQGGPPFCLANGELGTLLGEYFERTASLRVRNSVPVFEGLERWEVWDCLKPAT